MFWFLLSELLTFWLAPRLLLYWRMDPRLHMTVWDWGEGVVAKTVGRGEPCAQCLPSLLPLLFRV